MSPTEHALGYVVEDRARELADKCHWFRRILPGIAPSLRPAYQTMYQEWRSEFTVLLRLRRKARMIARVAEKARTAEIDRRIEHVLDAIEDEPFEGWREGQPEFNGAFR